MPQLFGTLNSDSTFSIGVQLYDPRHARRDRLRFRRELEPLLLKANSLYVPGGVWPTCGMILLKKSDYQRLNSYATNLALQITDFSNTLTFRGLTVVTARSVTTGVPGSGDAVYLAELTDARGVLQSPYFSFPTTSQYNVVAPAYPGQYYSASINAGTPLTWSQMVENLWSQMSAFLGAFPGLPSAPAGTPENWIFAGRSAWESLHRILDHLGMTVAVNPTSATPYTIVTSGGTDATFEAQLVAFRNRLEDDAEFIDTGSGRVPGQVVVYFHRRNEYYGTEETIRRDDLQWQSTPLYSVTIAAPATFSGAAGTGFLWDDFTVRYDVDNNPLAADVATAATIAAQRVQQFYDRIYDGTLGRMRKTYAGVLPFVTGGMVDGVRWYQDHKDLDRLSWRTEVVRSGHLPPWPEVVRGFD